MQSKIFLSFLLFLALSFFLSFDKLNTGMKRRVTMHVPDKVKRILSEPNYYTIVPSYIVNDSVSYSNQKANFSNFKKKYKKAYLTANTTQEKEVVLNKASEQLYQTLTDSLIPFWYGTPWDYNGISQKPGSGKIACGYFVFTLLRDAGIKLPRVKMSQAASEQAIKSIVPSTQIKRFSNKSVSNFETSIKKWGNGIYIVGLDNHIGLLQVHGQDVWFIHSTVIYPSCVIKERVSSSLAIEYSNYRVVGKLSDDKSLTKKWLMNEYIAFK